MVTVLHEGLQKNSVTLIINGSPGDISLVPNLLARFEEELGQGYTKIVVDLEKSERNAPEFACFDI